MKLFIVAALISAVSAARLEHLERGYLPPSQNNYEASAGGSSFPSGGAQGNFGLSSPGSQYGAPSRGSNALGSFGRSKDFASNGAGSNGFRTSDGLGSNNFGGNGLGGFSGRNGGSSAATSNQYLPPNYRYLGLHGDSTFDAFRPACTVCGSSASGSPQRYQHQNSNFGSQGLAIPSTQYGSPQSLIPSSTFGSQPSYKGQQGEPTGTSRQYLAPKSSGAQNLPQQPFNENTGYIY